ncbi:MAG: class I SAM-dependent methyltransferase [bacterium]|nr:class I SAM-dependent methyltransferase [Candidatus Kapabacteria bacterium]
MTTGKSEQPNTTDLWQTLYADTVSNEQTARECEFIQSFLPLDVYPTILDLACGTGRHSIELARRGYITTGADINKQMLEIATARARELVLDAWFVEMDLHDLSKLEGTFDGVILFWQTFGFFSGEARVGLFRDLQRLLRPKGRLILDLFNRLHYTHDRNEELYSESPLHVYSPFFESEHLRTMLSYEDELRFRDRRLEYFADPNLPAPGEIAGLTSNYELRMVASCSDYDPRIVATHERPRMQLVFEKT